MATMKKTLVDIDQYRSNIKKVKKLKVVGKVIQVVGLVIEAQVQGVAVGELCKLIISQDHFVYSEVVGFKDERVLLMPLDSVTGIKPGALVYAMGAPIKVKVGPKLLGRVLNGIGDPIDGKGELEYEDLYPVDQDPPDPMQRPIIKNIFETGIKSIDGLLTLGMGQRIGIFAGSGVGKSTLMGMLARNCIADINVISLIGERGREVRDFMEESLGEEGLRKSVVICATSDQPPVIRLKGALVGTAVAEYFRDQGKNVLFMMDSVTRFAMAQREVGLATGEPPTTKGYTPSVFAMLPRLMERAGTSAKGSITAIYTVLVDGGDIDEPIADTSRGILDGHIFLNRDLAAKNHYPCIDVGHSISRLMNPLASEEHKKAAGEMRDVLARYAEAEDLINIGAYAKGSNPKVDNAIDKIDAVNNFLKQRTEENITFNDSLSQMQSIF